MPIFDFLKAESQRRGWNITRTAEHCDVSVQLAARWLAEDPRKRITPGPASCRKIAAALGVDADYVLELAGHREPKPVVADAAPRIPSRLQSAALERSYRRWMEVMGPRMGEDVADDAFWGPILAQSQGLANQADTVDRALNTTAGETVSRAGNGRVEPITRPTDENEGGNRWLPGQPSWANPTPIPHQKRR